MAANPSHEGSLQLSRTSHIQGFLLYAMSTSSPQRANFGFWCRETSPAANATRATANCHAEKEESAKHTENTYLTFLWYPSLERRRIEIDPAAPSTT